MSISGPSVLPQPLLVAVWSLAGVRDRRTAVVVVPSRWWNLHELGDPRHRPKTQPTENLSAFLGRCKPFFKKVHACFAGGSRALFLVASRAWALLSGRARQLGLQASRC